MQRYNAEDENWYQTRDRLATLQNPPSGLTLVLHGECTKQTENKEDANMDSILDFFRAASPWVAMGLLLAIFFVRSAVKKKKDKKQDGDYGTEGMCLGMCSLYTTRAVFMKL